MKTLMKAKTLKKVKPTKKWKPNKTKAEPPGCYQERKGDKLNYSDLSQMIN